METANKNIYQVVWPKGKKTTKATSLSKRLDTLNGKTVALLWDYVFRGESIFKIIQDRLSKEFSDLNFVSYDNFGNIHDKDEAKVLAELPGRLEKYGCDAVISAVGC